MKIVQKSYDVEVIKVEDCDINSYYGVELPNNDIFRRSFVTFRDESFCLLSIKSLTGSYSYTSFKTIKIKDFLSALLKEDGKVYQFETFKELSDWLNT